MWWSGSFPDGVEGVNSKVTTHGNIMMQLYDACLESNVVYKISHTSWLLTVVVREVSSSPSHRHQWLSWQSSPHIHTHFAYLHGRSLPSECSARKPSCKRGLRRSGDVVRSDKGHPERKLCCRNGSNSELSPRRGLCPVLFLDIAYFSVVSHSVVGFGQHNYLVRLRQHNDLVSFRQLN